MEALFPDGVKILDLAGNTVSIASLCADKKYICLYFSAHWCPPCRSFTPTLVKFYEHMKSTPQGEDMEIIFVSSDKDKDSFESYFAEMKWLALDFDARDRKKELCALFGVQGIPTLVVLDAKSGEAITKDARSEVAHGDDNWAKFPWKST